MDLLQGSAPCSLSTVLDLRQCQLLLVWCDTVLYYNTVQCASLCFAFHVVLRYCVPSVRYCVALSYITVCIVAQQCVVLCVVALLGSSSESGPTGSAVAGGALPSPRLPASPSLYVSLPLI